MDKLKQQKNFPQHNHQRGVGHPLNCSAESLCYKRLVRARQLVFLALICFRLPLSFLGQTSRCTEDQTGYSLLVSLAGPHGPCSFRTLLLQQLTHFKTNSLPPIRVQLFNLKVIKYADEQNGYHFFLVFLWLAYNISNRLADTVNYFDRTDTTLRTRTHIHTEVASLAMTCIFREQITPSSKN